MWYRMEAGRELFQSLEVGVAGGDTWYVPGGLTGERATLTARIDSGCKFVCACISFNFFF